MQKLIKRFPMTTFFALAFLISWSLRIGLASIDFPLIKLVAEYAPLIAACVVSGALYGRNEVKALLGRLKQFRLAPKWYLFVIVGPVVIQLIAMGLFSLSTGIPFHFVPNLLILALVPLGILLSIGEEVGWRGFAQPHLQNRYGVVGAAVLIGVLWAFWHIPGDITSWSILAEPGTYVNFLWFLLSTVTGSLLLAWVYNRTQGKLPLMCIFHLTLTFFWSFTDAPSNEYYLFLILMAVGSVALFAVSYLRQKQHSQEKEAQPASLEA
jgi:uncharacterized protein